MEGIQPPRHSFVVNNVGERCIRSIIKGYMARNINYRMSSNMEKGPGGVCPVFLTYFYLWNVSYSHVGIRQSPVKIPALHESSQMELLINLNRFNSTYNNCMLAMSSLRFSICFSRFSNVPSSDPEKSVLMICVVKSSNAP